MAGALAVRENSSLISRLDRVLYSFELWLALIGGLTVFGLMLLAVVSVGGRTFFNAPLPGYVDWIEQAMPIIALLGIIIALVATGWVHTKTLWFACLGAYAPGNTGLAGDRRPGTTLSGLQ